MLAGLAGGLWALSGPAQEDWLDVAYQNVGLPEPPVDERAVDPVAGPVADTAAVAGDRRRLEVVGDRTAPVLAPARQVDASFGFPVRVVMKDGNAPVPGASVLYFDSLSPTYRRFRAMQRLYRADREAALNRSGERVVADQHGVAMVPHGIPSQAIVARHGDYYGELEVSGKHDPPDGGYVLTLERDRTVRVRVVDEAGEPVTGVYLTFYIGIRDKQDKLRWILLRDSNRNTGATDGVQELPHVQRFVDLLARLSKAEPVVHIGLDVPGMTRCGPALSLHDIPEETIQVVMAPVGKVVVRVTDQDGEPVVRRVRLSTPPDFRYLDLAGNPPALEPYRPKWDKTTDAAGRVEFDRVGVGAELRVESIGGGVTETERVYASGPGGAGETVEVQLVKAFTAAVIEGTVHDEHGQRLPETNISYSAGTVRGRPDTEYLARGTVRTDVDGRFRIRLPPTVEVLQKGKPVEANLYKKLKLSLAGPGTLHPEGAVELPERLANRRYAVGAVRLRLPTLIAAGRVLLDDKPARSFDRFVIDYRNPDQKNRWERVTDVKVHARPGGRFEVRGELRNRELRLRPRPWGCLPVAPVMLSPGQNNIEIRLYSAGTLRVAVLYDVETADANMEVILRPITIEYPQADPMIQWHFIGRIDKRGSGNLNFRRVYWWSGLPPGRYRVELRLLGQRDPFAVLDQLQPVFRQRLDDVTPEVIDLRGAVRRVLVRAQDSKGRPISGMVFPLGQTAIETVEGVALTRQGAVLHTTRRDGVDVEVVARGYRTEQVYGVSRERVVQMRPGIPITVNLASLRVPKGVKVAVKIRRRTYDFQRLYRAALKNPIRAQSGARPLTILMGEREVPLRYRGRWQWKATVMEHGQFVLVIELSRQGKPPVKLTGYSPYLLMVRDTATEHTFSVSVARNRLNRALQDLGVELPATKKPAGKKPAGKQPARKKSPRKKPPGKQRGGNKQAGGK